MKFNGAITQIILATFMLGCTNVMVPFPVSPKAASTPNSNSTVLDPSTFVYGEKVNYAASANSSVVASVALSPSGDVYTAGAAESAGGNRWIVRKYSAGTSTTIDNFLLPSANQSQANAISVDSSGNVYVAGRAVVHSLIHWIVRKYSAGVWTTIDDYIYTAGQGTEPFAIANDTLGNLYVAGSGADSSSMDHWIVRKFSSGTWSVVEDYQYPSGVSATPTSLYIDLSNNVYCAGRILDSSYSSHLIVRKAVSGTWSGLDDYAYPSGSQTGANSVTVDVGGNVYVAGSAYDSSSSIHWIVRKYSSGAWNSLDDYQLNAGSDASAASVAVDSSGNVFAGGYATSSSSVSHWMVRKYTSGAWSTSDDYLLQSSKNALAQSLTADHSGNIYVIGSGKDTNSIQHWVIRENHAGSWSVIDDYNFTSASGISVAFSVDHSSNVYAVGYAVDSSGSNHWLVRKFSAGTWSVLDDYQYTTGVDSNPSSVATNLAGDVFVAGIARDGSSNLHWIVRKYSAGVWTTLDDYLNPSGQTIQTGSIAVDAAGSIYVVGNIYGPRSHWVVRKYSSGSWSFLDDYQTDSTKDAIATAIAISTTGTIYVAGYASDSSNTPHWLVRKYSSGAWSIFDDYQYPGGSYIQALAITTDSAGNVYTSGWASDGTNRRWIVRKYTSSWSTIDDYLYAGTNSFPQAIAVNLTSDVFVVGYGSDSGDVNHSLVRKYSAGAWTLTQDFQTAAGLAAQANGVVYVPNSSRVLVCGQDYNLTGDAEWFVIQEP